jgi:membrane protein
MKQGFWEKFTSISFGEKPIFPAAVASLARQVVKGFLADQCFLRASALTFATILSLVPFLAFAFAILKGLGVQNALEPIILNHLTAGSHEIVDRIVTYINQTNMTSVGAIGLATLVGTVISLLGTIEEAFNMVWGVGETRTLARKFSDYLSVVVSAPLLVLAATSINTTLQSQTAVTWIIANTYLGPLILGLFRVLPYVSIWAALVFVYIFIPNTRVSFRSAVVGGIFAGTIWQLAQWAHLTFQLGVAKYNAIYGTLAVLPVFMLWIYISWLVVLLGVEVVHAHQNRGVLEGDAHRSPLSAAARDKLALVLTLSICQRFCAGERAPTVDELSLEFVVPRLYVEGLLSELAGDGFVARGGNGDEGWLPARDPERITAADLLETVRGAGHPLQFPDASLTCEAVKVLAAETCRDSSRLGTITMKDLVRKD